MAQWNKGGREISQRDDPAIHKDYTRPSNIPEKKLPLLASRASARQHYSLLFFAKMQNLGLPKILDLGEIF